MSIYDSLIKDLKKQRTKLNRQIHQLEDWRDPQVKTRTNRFKLTAKQRALISKRMKEMWKRKRKESK